MTTTPPSTNKAAYEALARSCREAVNAMRQSEQEAEKFENRAFRERQEAATQLITINALREVIASRFPDASGRVDGDKWAHPQEYDADGKYRPIQGDIAPSAPAIDMATALNAVKRAMAADPELAWSWQCNIAMPLFDAVRNISHWQANVGAARLMRHLFDVDMTEHKDFKALEQNDKDAAVRLDSIAAPSPAPEHLLYTEKASEVRTMLSEAYDKAEKQGWWAISFGQLCDVMNLLTPTSEQNITPAGRLSRILADMDAHAQNMTDEELRDFSDTISAELERLGGDPVEEVVQGSTEDLRPLIAYPARRVSFTFTHPTIGEGFFTSHLMHAMREFSEYMGKMESLPTLQEVRPEPRYPFTASNGVVVDVLPWKTVGECGDIPAFPFLSAHDQLTKMTDIIREAADAAKELAGVPGSELEQKADQLVSGMLPKVEKAMQEAEQEASVGGVSYVAICHPNEEPVVYSGTDLAKDEPNKPHPFEGKMIRPKGQPDIEPVLFTGRTGEDGAFITVKNLQTGKTGAYVAKDEAFEVAGDAPKVEEVKEWTLASAPPDHRTVVEPSSNRGVPVGNDTPRPEHDAETKSKLIFPAEPSAQPEPVKNLFRVFRDGKPTITLDVYGAAEAVQKLMQPKPEPAPLRPTIGRRVWFFCDERYGQSGLHINDHAQPCDAGIVYVWSDELVNLDVTDHHGNHHAFTSVTLVPPGEERPTRGYWCEWMPFQVGQAKAK